MIPDADALSSIQARMQDVTRHLRLPLRNHAWRGMSGSWLGTGTGSSIDFQDHRPYMPGDDPRYIDWQAYARSGHYTMKLYREEVSPSVDLALDVSGSMFLNEPKATRAMELFYFAVASALQSRGSLRCYLVAGETVLPLATEAVLAGETLAEVIEPLQAAPAAPALWRIPWRVTSLRVWISDLLFPGEPALTPLTAGKGRGVLLAPWCRAEGEPDWAGNVEFVDCETAARRPQQVDAALLERYHEAYARHFQLWREQARRNGVAFSRVRAEPGLVEALREEALLNGAVEVVT